MSEDIHSDELLKQIQKLLNLVNLLKNVCEMWYVVILSQVQQC